MEGAKATGGANGAAGAVGATGAVGAVGATATGGAVGAEGATETGGANGAEGVNTARPCTIGRGAVNPESPPRTVPVNSIGIAISTAPNTSPMDLLFTTRIWLLMQEE